MSKYICTACGYIDELDKLNSNYVCPICGANSDKFELESDFETDDIGAIIDSVIEESNPDEVQKIINDVQEDKRIRVSEFNPAIARINEKCINCGQCKKTCANIVNLRYDLNKCKNPICLGCGQCILNCPTGAMVPKYEYRQVMDLINANEKIIIALIAPGVKVSMGENFNIDSGINVEGKMVSALRKLGFDYVFDVCFGADLTILEEVAEFANRLTSGGALPQFTSCCPAWVKYAEIYHPELLDNISTCKSPIGMQCAIIKSYFAEKQGYDSNKMVTVAITPCTSKKMEAKEYTANIDYVMTASELSLLLKEEDIKLNNLSDGKYDKLMGESSGAGNMFGASGGVTESVIRTLNRILSKTNLKGPDLVFNEIRGMEGIKEATVIIDKYKLRVAVVQQMENLEELLKDNRYKKYHFIEVMNCKGGCIGGGGQPLCPINQLDKYKVDRSNGLYNTDIKKKVRCAHDNTELKLLYKEYLKKPLSEKSLSLLHTSYSDKSDLLENKH